MSDLSRYEPERELQLSTDPGESLDNWITEAGYSALQRDPTAMTLATVRSDGTPAARIVLLKGLSRKSPEAGTSGLGLEFYTNYDSAKSDELSKNPKATLLFYWNALMRQIRIEGHVQKVTREESQAYFSTRPRESQIGAWASLQSRPMPSRQALIARVEEAETRFANKEVACPDNWGGFRLTATAVEFWELRAFRLHERFLYQWQSGKWNRTRLSP